MKEPSQQWCQSKLYPYLTDALVFMVLAALAFAIYCPAIGGPFIFDDEPNILNSPAIRMTEFSFLALKKVAVEGFMTTRPVANISFALNYLTGKYGVSGYHVVNILLHAVNGFLLFLLLRLTLQIAAGAEEKKFAPVLPLVAALIWLVHPMQSQAVAYIVQRMTSLAALFYLLAMLLYARARLAGGMRPKVLLFSGSFLAGLLALASKEIAATLPLFIFLYEWYFFQDLKGVWLKRRWIYLAMTVVSLLAISLFFLGSHPIGRIMSGYQTRDFNLGQRLLTELRVLVVYLSEILLPLPSRLCLEHDISLSSSLLAPMATLFSALILVVLVGAAVWLARRERLISFAIVWYLGNLLIESSVVSLEIIFEHRNYLPSMFFILLLVLLGERFIRPVRIKMLLVLAIISLFSFWTYERSTVWADDETLLRDCTKKAPNKFRMYYNLGTSLAQKGRYDEAISTYYQALMVYPEDPRARGKAALYTNLGNALSSKGEYRAGNSAFYQALRLNPVDSRAYLGLGNNSLQQGNYKGAEAHYRKALALATEPGIASQIRDGLDIVLQKKGADQEP